MNRVIAILFACALPACGNDSSSGGADMVAGADMAAGGGTCSAARAQLLGSIDSVSTGAVDIITTSGATRTLFVDASAGGINGESSHPWIFVNLGSGTEVNVTDKTSVSSAAWDLALKRPIIYTNSGDGGAGQGGAVLVTKDFAQVTAADAASATFVTESFFDAQCNPKLDPTSAVLTSFSSWYDYDPSSHMLTPAAGTWLVHGGDGKLYAVQILTYYGSPSGVPDDGGTTNSEGGTYVLEVKAL
jgi:heme-binding HmuY-like protein